MKAIRRARITTSTTAASIKPAMTPLAMGVAERVLGPADRLVDHAPVFVLSEKPVKPLLPVTAQVTLNGQELRTARNNYRDVHRKRYAYDHGG